MNLSNQFSLVSTQQLWHTAKYSIPKLFFPFLRYPNLLFHYIIPVPVPFLTHALEKRDKEEFINPDSNRWRNIKLGQERNADKLTEKRKKISFLVWADKKMKKINFEFSVMYWCCSSELLRGIQNDVLYSFWSAVLSNLEGNFCLYFDDFVIAYGTAGKLGEIEQIYSRASIWWPILNVNFRKS